MLLALSSSIRCCASIALIALASACEKAPPLTIAATRHGVPLPVDSRGFAKPIELNVIDTVQVTVRAKGAPGVIRQLSIWLIDATATKKGVAPKPQLLISVEKPIRSANGAGVWEALYTLDVRERLGNSNYLEMMFRGRVDYVDGKSLQLDGTRLVAGVTQVNLHIVAMQNDDGSMAAQVQPGDFSTLLTRTNRSFRNTGIQIALDPAVDFETFRRTALNREQSGWTTIADSIAAAHPTRVVCILRWGPGASFTGNANAFPPPGASPKHSAMTDVDQKFVMLEHFLNLSQNGYLNLLWGSHLAHEIGHYLGLYHTFVGWEDWNPVYTSAPATPTPAQVQQALIDFVSAHGGSASALDGDQLSDTPPDPSGPLYRALGKDPCTSNTITAVGSSSGVATTVSFSPSTTNAMSYLPQCSVEPDGTGTPLTFTAQQTGVMHHVITTVPSRKLVVSRAPLVPVP